MEDVNLTAVVAATVAMFLVGGIWYMPLFGKFWGKIHDFDKLDKKTQKEMQAKMGPWYGVQLVVTVISAFVLAKFITMLPDESPYSLAAMLWLGFVFPTQLSANIFGGAKSEWIWHKTAVQTAESLVHLLVAAWVITTIG